MPHAARWAALAACACSPIGCGGVDVPHDVPDDLAVHCRVDPTAACRCILGAGAFSAIEGCGVEACEDPLGGLKKLVDGCADRVREQHGECESMGVVMQCARDMDCVDAKVQESCQHVMDTHDGCRSTSYEVNCDSSGSSWGAPHAAGLGLVPVLAALLT